MPQLSDIPDATVKHTDWEVATVMDVTVAAGWAGGAWLFSFRNGTYHTDVAWSGLVYDILFLGGGGGLGLKPGLGKLAGIIFGRTQAKHWHKIKADRPFSAYDLGGGLGSQGRITCLTPGIYKFLYISAYNMDGAMFHSQYLGGWGLGALASVLIGTWQYLF
jgi:hypothetical protein